ncbi:MAG: RDD family protein [Alphaproteobacteria bacterium]|nr:RDD family protein [Alphaproteobacteria bacterium]
MHKVKRKLTTIFCADVVGYSRLMGADEHGTLVRLKQCRELMQAFIERHHGRVVSWSGDAVLADFSSVVESVQCAVEIQRELKAQNESISDSERMDFRIGINLGDVMIDDHDIFGEGVNIAARLQSLATPGGILISGSVHDQVKNKVALGFNFMGNQQVKNISEQVPVFVVTHDVVAAMPIAGSVALGGLGRTEKVSALKAPALLPLRFGATVVDVLLACVLTFALAVFLDPSMGPAFEIDAPYSFFATQRTLSTDLPSTDIEGGGEVVRTTTRSVIERNYFGLIRQNYRRTDVELTGDRLAISGARQLKGSSVEVLLDARGKQSVSRPSLLLATILVYFLIAILTEGFFMRGASPGKALLGLRVSTVRGEAAGLQEAALRNLAKIASVATALIGVLMALWSKRGQMLHDHLAGCYVHDVK